MPQNRLEVSLAVPNAEEGLRKLRVAKTEMRGLEDAANDAERNVDELGDEFDQTGRKADRYGRSVGQSSRQTDGLSRAAAAGVSRLAAMGAAAAATGVSLAAIGSVRVSANFESEFSKVNTLLDETSFRAGAANDNIAGLKLGLRELRAESGDSFANLSKGLFDLVSAGVAAEDSIRVLNDANVLAKAGVTDVSIAVDGLTTVINAYGEEADRSEVLASKFFTAQKFGKTTVEELARGLGQVAPLAAQLGVTFDELLASQAAATSAGIRQSEAYTGLKAALTNIVKPSKDAADEADRLGVAFDTAALKSKGLTDFLADIQASANFTDESFQKLFGSAEALNFALAVTGGGAEVYAKTLRELGDETQSVITLNEAYEKAVNVADQANKEFAGSLDQLFIIAGDAGALEAYTEVVRGLVDALRSDAAKEFAAAFGQGFIAALGAAKDGVQTLSDAFRGLSIVIQDVGGDIAQFLGLDILERLAEFPAVQEKLGEAFSAAAGNVINPAQPIIDALTEIGKRAREADEALEALEKTEPISVNIAADVSDLIADVGTAEEAAAEFEKRLSAVGEDTVIGGALRAFDNLNKSLVAASDNATKTAESIESIKPPEVGAVQRALLDQLEIAERLAEAAKGGVIRYEIELNAIELEQLAEQAVAKAKEAGEELSLATARMIVGQIDNLDKAAQAMLDAEKALRERAADRSDDIAQSLEDRIGDFTVRVQDTDLRLAGANAAPLLEALDRQFLKLADEIEDLSIGLNTEQLEDLYAELEDAGILLGEKIEEGARVGAFGLGEAIRQAIRDGANELQVIADTIGGFARVGQDIFGSLSRSLALIRDPNASVSDKVLGSIEGIGDKVANAVAQIPGAQPIAAVIQGVSEVAGFVKDAISFFKDLFGKRSDLTAQGVFNAGTGQIAGVAQDRGADENARARDALIDSITEAGRQLTALLGGAVQRNIPGTAANENFLNVAVRSDRKTGQPFIDVGFQGPGGEPTGGGRFTDPQQAFDAAIKLVIQSLKGGESALVSYAQAAAASGQSFNDIVSVLGVLNNALDSGQETLAKYALAAAKGGLSADQITDGLNKIDAALKLAAPELSNVERALKDVDSAIDPAVAALKAAGQAFGDIAEIGREAGRAVAVNFLEGIQEDIDRAQSESLADFKALLKQQAQDLADAQLLLGRGLINQDEFRTVEQRNALQQAAFFEGLDQDALNELGDFLGLIRENGGEAAVVLLQFNQELDRTRERLTEGLSAMREEADRFFDAARANLNLASDIRLRLSGETGSAQLVTFRAELQGLLAQVQGPDRIAAVEAAERAPDVAQQFIQLAEQRLGASGGLGEARDFVTDILDQIGTAAQGFGNQTLDEIALAEQQVSLLDQIKGVLESPDPAFGILEGILANGEIQSATLRDLLDQYIQLSFDGPAQNFTPGQVQQAAQQIVLPSELRISNTVTTDAPSTTLAITTAASQAKQDAAEQREILLAQERRIGEMQETIARLDSTLRNTA